MEKILFVGLGGALGAVCRYGISMLPWKGSFPVLTLITNLIGAVLIGLVVGAAESREMTGENLVLFLKTGVCGGFTTFSTFSLEALKLLEGGKRCYGVLYILLSVAGCICGVWIGRKAMTARL